MQAHAAAADFPATPEVDLVLVAPEARARTAATMKRFEQAIQSLLDAPLDAARVLEWATLRTLDA